MGKKKIKVLMVVNHALDYGHACTLYRAKNPTKYSRKVEVKYKNDIKVEWLRKEGQRPVPYLDTEDLEWADVIVFHKMFYTVPEAGALAEVAMKMGKPVIYETDDLIHRIEQNTGRAEASDKVKNSLRFVDWLLSCPGVIVTTSTEYLAEKMKERYGDDLDVHVMGNFYDPQRWYGLFSLAEKKRKKFQKHGGGKVRIGWQGGNNHLIKNIDYIIEPLNMLNKKRPGEFTFVCLSSVHPNVMLYPDIQKNRKMFEFDIEHHDGVSLDDHPRKLAELGLDIGLAVVEDHEFSRAKTAIKWMEYGLLGIPTIASDVLPYQNTNAILVDNSPEQWLDAIEDLMDNREKRVKIGLEARNIISRDYNVKNKTHLWDELYGRAVNKNL